MKKSALAAGFALALAGTGTWAGQGIQIDPTGTGCLSCSFSANNIGSDFGDALLQEMVNAAGGNRGRVYAHNVFDLDTAGDSGELTFVMWMDAIATPKTDIGVFGTEVDPNSIILTNPDDDLSTDGLQFASYFALYYDPLDGSAGSGLAADHDTGSYYDDGFKLATGTVSIDLSALGGGSFTANVQGSALGHLDGDFGADAIAGNLDEPTDINSVEIQGNVFLNVEFTDVSHNPGYLINNLVTLGIDMEANGGLRAPYEDVLASDVVGGTGGASLNAGSDNENDFTCQIVGNQSTAFPQAGFPLAQDQDCDVQVQITSVLDFSAETIPEPTTLGLIGAGLGLAGLFSRRRKKAVV